MLDITNLDAAYGPCQVLFGVALGIGAGEVVTLLGRNGMGKTTTVHSIMGILPTRSGSIRFAGAPIERLPSYRVAKAGLGLVPEGRHVFPNLTVRENLMATAANRSAVTNPWTLDTVLDLLPALARRLTHYGNQLSGGEQQMVAIGRALMTNPRLLILDEATEGLAPLIREEIWRCLKHLKSLGQAILLIDKNIEALGRIADHHYIIEKGRIVWHGRSGELMGDPSIRQRYLGV